MTHVAEEALDLCLVEQVDRLQNGEVMVTELIDAALKRAERLQENLNCFIQFDRDQALARARALDALPSERRRALPLFGVPAAHKDLFARRGRVVTYGSKLYAKHRATTTATLMRKFDEAGAVDIGTLNLSEFASNPYGLNILVGHVRNPWNPSHIAGGSSSGSAAAVASRIIPASLGSDTGGSIRIPAAACGVFGLLPTNGRVSRHGMLPLSHSLDNPGPLARSARDLARILGIVAGHDAGDPASSHEPVADYEGSLAGGVAGVRVATAVNYYPDLIDADTANMMQATVATLRDLGATIVPLTVPEPPPLDALGNQIIVAEAAAYHRKDLIHRGHLFTPMVRDRFQFGFSVDAPSYVDALRLRAVELRRFMQAVFDAADLLLLPALPCAPPRYDEIETALKRSSDLSFALGKFTRSINYLGLPAVAVPHGRASAGLPLAFQIVGRPFDEALILRAAHAFEQAVPPHFPELQADSGPALPATRARRPKSPELDVVD